LQGYVSCCKAKRLSGFKKLVGERAHVEICKGTEEDNVKYCTKDHCDFREFGRRSIERKRTDLDAFKEAVKAGVRDKVQLRESFSEVAARYPRFFDQYILDNTVMAAPCAHPLRNWQIELDSYLNKPPDDRTVIFVVDTVGNTGKSWFTKQYCYGHPNSCLLEPGKKADMAYMLPEVLKVLFIDVTRKQAENMDHVYSFIESCKNGRVFSSKYESRVKYYGPMHVVVMMNQHPDMTALSEDRYLVIDLGRNKYK